MQVLVLGGTSFFGKDIVRAFFSAGHSVTVFTRGNKRPTDLPKHQQLTGNRRSISDLMTVGKGKDWDVVIDNIGYTAEDAEILVKAFPNAKHLIFDSSVSVYRFAKTSYPQPLLSQSVDNSVRPAQEDPHDIHWKYARGKMEAEEIIRKKSTIPWTIIRPPVVYGPDDPTERGFWYLLRLLEGGPLILANGGIQSFRLSYSKDVAQAFLKAALNPKAHQKSYFIGQKEIITLKDFLDESAKCLGVVPNYVSVPLEIAKDLGGPHSSMINIIPDISEAERDLELRPTPFPQFIKETTNWFKEHWKGSREELLKSRPLELLLAQKWKNVIEEFL